MRTLTPSGEHRISLSVGESLELELEELPGAGFLWQLDERLDDCARLETSVSTPPGADEGIGAASVRTVRIVATEPGEGVLSGFRGQPWEGPDKADRRFTIRLRVE